MAVSQSNQQQTKSKKHQLNRRQFLASTSITLAAASLGLSSETESELARSTLSFTPQQPPRNLTELQSEHPDFESYLCWLQHDAGPTGFKDFSLSEALFYVAHDSSLENLCPAFDYDALQREFYEIANAIGLALAKEHPWIVGANREEICRQHKKSKIAVLQSLNEMFYNTFSVDFNRKPLGDITTISEMIEIHGGTCEDLTGAYCALVQILQQGGIDLPIYPMLIPNHVLAGWDDRPYQDMLAKPARPTLLIELTTPGGAILESSANYYIKRLVSNGSKGYMTALPLETALSAELRNRAVAYRMSNQRNKLPKAYRDITAALKLTPSADKYMALQEILAVMDGDHQQEEFEALTQAIALDPSARKPRVALASWYHYKGLLRESDPHAKMGCYYRASQALNEARQRPLMFFERMRPHDTNDAAETETIFYLEAQIAQDCYSVSTDESHYKRAIAAANSCITSGRDESAGSWLVKRRSLAYTLKANLHEQHFQNTDQSELGDLDLARQDWLALADYACQFDKEEWTKNNAFENAARISLNCYNLSPDKKEYYLQEAEQAYHWAWLTSEQKIGNRYLAAKAIILTLQGKLDDGLELFNEVLNQTAEGSPDYLIALVWRGAAHLELGQSKAAKKDFSAAIQLYRRTYPSRDLNRLIVDTLCSENPAGETSSWLT